MTRRDMIILAVLVNTGLLTIIFMMAIISSDDSLITQEEEPIAIVQKKSQFTSQTPIEIPIIYPEDNKNTPMNSLSIAEQTQEILVADVLNYIDHDEDYHSETEHSMIVAPTSSQIKIGPPSKIKNAEIVKNNQDTEKKISITVKSGDTLDKIARANGTTVAILRESNQLKSDRLNIGQILQIPVKSAKEEKESTTTKTDKTTKIEPKALNRVEPEFYTVKSGDNPTKIAKLFQIKVEDILRLNNMTVERSRNLKIGERIRIK